MIKVLIPTDFTDSSENALKQCLVHFKNVEAEFILMHSFNYQIVGFAALDLLHEGEDFFKHEQSKSLQKLKNQTKSIRSLGIGTFQKLQIISIDLNLEDSLKKLIPKHNIQLVYFPKSFDVKLQQWQLHFKSCLLSQHKEDLINMANLFSESAFDKKSIKNKEVIQRVCNN
tara:strand:- start:2767 stop:3279 length:513 start_codon:yes stop_codon:yes gene_type:complete